MYGAFTSFRSRLCQLPANLGHKFFKDGSIKSSISPESPKGLVEVNHQTIQGCKGSLKSVTTFLLFIPLKMLEEGTLCRCTNKMFDMISRYLSCCVLNPQKHKDRKAQDPQSDMEEFTHMGKGFWFSSVNWAVICRLLWQRLSEPQAFWMWI